MSRSAKILTGLLFLLTLTGLGTADAVLTREGIRYPGAVEDGEGGEEGEEGEEPGRASLDGGVRKPREPEVFAILSNDGITTEEAREESLLQRVVPSDIAVVARTLLKDDDRLGLFAFVSSPNVKSYFLALKEALHTSFSPQLQDLTDETRSPEGRPVMNILSFTDPAIASERILFVRVRERLYEFRFPPEKQEEIDVLVGDLTR